MNKPVLWLLLSRLDHPEVPYAVPSLSWMARETGATLEIYLESERTGELFAETGSTVLGGNHHLQFNYLCSRFDVRILRLGKTSVFESTIQAFGLKAAASGNHAAGLYSHILQAFPDLRPAGLFFGPSQPLNIFHREIRLQAYLFPEILHRRSLGFPASSYSSTSELEVWVKDLPIWTAFAENIPKRSRVKNIDSLRKGDDWRSITGRIARRWKKLSKGVVFGDPAAVLSQLATHCRHNRVALYAPVKPAAPSATRVSGYVESASPAADEAAALAIEIGNPVIHGRQTGDGDIFQWSRRGVCIQIVDPNRPAFPAIEMAEHPWTKSAPAPDSVSDRQLRTWAKEGRVLTSLLIHSGEVAHNEAMLALIEMAGWRNLKMGLGVHAQRYETCPQLWEMLAIAREHGGASGLIEPLLHSGGRGVLAECNCPPALLAEHCHRSLERIRHIAGPAHTPSGYYAFMDSNLDLLNEVRGDVFSAISSSGIRHIFSSARPGRNRLLWRTERCLALNQTVRIVHASSPFVRGSTPDDFGTCGGASGPGWIITSLDAPVVAFPSYIWREGAKIMAMADRLQQGSSINVLPSTIARYARVLDDQGLLPPPATTGNKVGIAS